MITFKPNQHFYIVYSKAIETEPFNITALIQSALPKATCSYHQAIKEPLDKNGFYIYIHPKTTLLQKNSIIISDKKKATCKQFLKCKSTTTETIYNTLKNWLYHTHHSLYSKPILILTNNNSQWINTPETKKKLTFKHCLQHIFSSILLIDVNSITTLKKSTMFTLLKVISLLFPNIHFQALNSNYDLTIWSSYYSLNSTLSFTEELLTNQR